MENINPKRVIPAAAFVVCAVGVAVLGKSRLNTPQEKTKVKSNFTTSSSPKPSTPKQVERKSDAPATKIIVQIDGAVAKPGLYEIDKGTRTEQLLEIAGGVLDGADLSKVNRAEILKDGEKVVVPYAGSKFVPFRNQSAGPVDSVAPVANPPVQSNVDQNSAPIETSPQPQFPISLNSATKEQLESLPGVGSSLAGKIIDYRDGIGGFKSIEELDNVRGIGPALLEKIRPLVTL